MDACIKERCFQIPVFLLMGLGWHAAMANQLANTVSNSGISSPVNASTVGPQQRSFLSKFNPKHATILIQGGGFQVSQGHTQHIGIDGLVGDDFTVNHKHANNVLLGLGYYFDRVEKSKFTFLYGINAFYLAPTSVQGNVIQEQLFTNLSYRYSLTNYLVYAAAKILVKNSIGTNDLTFDLGMGPNFIKTSHFTENSLDGGVTLPDNAFSGKTSTVFSATIGAGIKFNKVLGLPCELSYRFFYLNEGSFNKENEQLLNTLRTGNQYANALIFSIYA